MQVRHVLTIELKHTVHKFKRGSVSVSVNLNIVDEVFPHLDPLVGIPNQ
ncbi:Uncharacterised protein [Streptococcus pneumoniae]|nr:Uncharacterised protein [Streptococcus pneumoniae]CIV86505.1 Uncharacterised protein [Streptococcus pneumoniae]